MKKTISIMIGMVCLAALFGCAKQSVSTENVSTRRPVFFQLPAGNEHLYEYRDTSHRSKEQTEYCDGKGLNLPMLDQVVQSSYDKGTYTLDGEEYVVVENPDPSVYPYEMFYEWSVDRQFFYQFAATDRGDLLYRNTNNDRTDALILVQPNGNERILFKKGSSLERPDLYDINDFGVVVFNPAAFAWAADYSDVFYAHTVGKDSSECEDYVRFPYGEKIAKMTFECTVIPGLRYSMCCMVDHDTVYVSCRSKDCFVSFVPQTKLAITWEQIFWEYFSDDKTIY